MAANGDIFVADYNNHRVVKWAPGATEGVLVAGGNGAGNGAGPACTWNPGRTAGAPNVGPGTG